MMLRRFLAAEYVPHRGICRLDVEIGMNFVERDLWPSRTGRSLAYEAIIAIVLVVVLHPQWVSLCYLITDLRTLLCSMVKKGVSNGSFSLLICALLSRLLVGLSTADRPYASGRYDIFHHLVRLY
ncbi:hypothetical protein EDB84DRAFT_1473761 [Lactarius hengduanensis]|nr:hypothetical protein EDB84DRAFT_1473761 [Lactarius hengduanensis]